MNFKKNSKKHNLLLPYQGGKGSNIINSLKNKIRLTLPKNAQTKIIYIATNLRSKLSIKDCIPFGHNHDLIYQTVCPDDNCNRNYIGKSARKLKESVKDH